jgi:hypothetical protein
MSEGTEIISEKHEKYDKVAVLTAEKRKLGHIIAATVRSKGYYETYHS